MHPRLEMKGGAFVFGTAGRQQVTVRNLSRGGIGIRVERAPKRGESVRVVLSLDGKSWIDLRGVVRYLQPVHRGWDCGIELRGSDPKLLDQVDAYVRRASARLAAARERPASTESGRHRLVRDASGKLRPVTAETPAAPNDEAAPADASKPDRTPRPMPRKRESKELAALYKSAMKDLNTKKK